MTFLVPRADLLTLVFITVWDTIDSHNAVQNGESYPNVLQAVKKCFDESKSDFQMVHMLSRDPIAQVLTVLTSPLTEIAFFEEKDASTIMGSQDAEFMDTIVNDDSRTIHSTATWGPIAENGARGLLLAGWASLEVSSMFNFAYLVFYIHCLNDRHTRSRQPSLLLTSTQSEQLCFKG